VRGEESRAKGCFGSEADIPSTWLSNDCIAAVASVDGGRRRHGLGSNAVTGVFSQHCRERQRRVRSRRDRQRRRGHRLSVDKRCAAEANHRARQRSRGG
jgi:hypothetical protein